jgi:hypothetical protein
MMDNSLSAVNFYSEPPLSPAPAFTGEANTPDHAPGFAEQPARPLAPVVEIPQVATTPAADFEPETKAPSLERMLLKFGLLTPAQLGDAMREESASGRPLWEIVQERGWVSRDDLIRLAERSSEAEAAPEHGPVVADAAPAYEPAPVEAAPLEAAPAFEPAPFVEAAPVAEPAPAFVPAPAFYPPAVAETAPVYAPTPAAEPAPVVAAEPVFESAPVAEPAHVAPQVVPLPQATTFADAPAPAPVPLPDLTQVDEAFTAPVPDLTPVATPPAPTPLPDYTPQAVEPAPAPAPEPELQPAAEVAPVHELVPAPVEPEPVAAPVVELQQVAVEALAPEPAPPGEVAPAPVARPAPANEEFDVETGTPFKVVLRLSSGERIDAHTCNGATAARRHAEELVRGLASGLERWPYFSGRFVRPESIISVDVEASL